MRNTAYVLGHSDQELERLERQNEIYAEQTELVLRSAGLREGMRVLDIGCGVGDVSLIAARIVGPSGFVRGVDRSAEALAMARRRLTAADITWVRLDQSEIQSVPEPERYDALIGRFILLYFPDPASVLRHLRRHLLPDAVVAFMEMDVGSAAVTPPIPLFERCMEWILELYRRAEIEPNMGSRLYRAFRQAGFTPTLNGSCRVEGGPDSPGYAYLAQTIRSLTPSLTAAGVATVEDIDIETLAVRLRAEALEGDHCFVFPRLIGAWARN